jgi:hypothetical protein
MADNQRPERRGVPLVNAEYLDQPPHSELHVIDADHFIREEAQANTQRWVNAWWVSRHR